MTSELVLLWLHWCSGQCWDWLVWCLHALAGWYGTFDQLLLSGCDSTCNCLSRSVPEMFAGVTGNQQTSKPCFLWWIRIGEGGERGGVGGGDSSLILEVKLIYGNCLICFIFMRGWGGGGGGSNPER